MEINKGDCLLYIFQENLYFIMSIYKDRCILLNTDLEIVNENYPLNNFDLVSWKKLSYEDILKIKDISYAPFGHKNR